MYVYTKKSDQEYLLRVKSGGKRCQGVGVLGMSVYSVFFSVGVLSIFWYRSLVSKRREAEESDLLTASSF